MSSWILFLLIAAITALVIALVVTMVLHRRNKPEPIFERSREALELDGKRSSKAAPEAEEPSANADIGLRRRMGVFGGVVGAFFGVLLFRLWGMQLVSGASYSERAERNLTREVSIKAPRGRILDRNGNILVDNRPSLALVADKDVAENSRLVKRISNLLGMPEVAVRHNIQSATEGAQSLRTIMIDVPQSAVAYVVEHPGQFPGVEVESRSVRSYPHGKLACHLLGYTGAISSDELKHYADDESNLVAYRMGDTVGKTGIEYQYESVLQGVRGTRTVHVDANGDVTDVVGEVPARAGSDVRLTVDLAVQRAAESAIQTSMAASRSIGYKPTGGAVVCINCKTGEVLAMASYPDYDPSSFIGGINTSDWANLVSEDANNPLLNRVIDGQYPSASTIKALSACAALESGVATSESFYECTGWWTGMGEADGKGCWNLNGHGWLNLRDGIVNSCDVVFYEIAKAFYYSDNPEGLQEMFRRWGLGSRTGVDLPDEYPGRIPDADWKWNWFTWYDDIDRQWHPGDTANIVIGQGDLLVTPLQMAYVYCGLVNHGVEMWPHLMLDVLSNDTHAPLLAADAHPQNQVPIDQSILQFVDEALWGVVNESASTADYFQGLPVQVMGKSGTAEAGEGELNSHAWFVAAAPYEDPTYVVASFLELGGGGSAVASHMCREVLGAIYGVEMTDPVELLRAHGASATRAED